MKNSRQHFNVVILDDDFLIKEVLKKLIKRYLPDAEFFVSNNGLEGIGLIELHAPQLIIADATLPKYAGAELVNRLKNTKGFTADTNVVFLHESDKFPELNDPAIIKLNKSDISFIKEFEKYLAFTFSKTPQYSFREKAQNILGGVIVKVSNYCDVLMHSVSKSRSLLHIPRYLIWIILQVYLSFVMTIFYIFTGGRVPENKNTSARELTLYRVRYYPTIVTITLAVIGIVFQTFAFLVAGLAILNQNINFLIAQSVCPLPAAPSIINNQVTLTPDNEDGIIDCSAVDIIVGSTGELIIEKRVDGNGNTQGDYGVTLLVNNLTVQSGGKVNADGKGYSIVETDAGAGKGGSSSGQTGGAGGGHGGAGGQGIEDGVNASGFGGTPYGNNETPITLGAAGGNGGNTAGNFQRSWSSNAHFTALGTSFSEGLESPVAGGLALKASSQDPLTYSTGEQTWFSGIIDAAQFELFKPTNITADWTLDGTDNIAPKFQIWGSATGSFSGEQAVYPAADAYYQNGGTYSINDNSQLSITDQVQTFYRYWQVKIILETGATDTDTPKVVSLTINGATQQSSNPSGGAGGGALKIVASQAVVIDGTISANGLDGQASGNTSGGGGAGGSIWILANTFAGSGSVQAKGGSAAEVTYQGGGGGGGRIVMLCTTSNGFTGTASVTPGVTANSQDGGVGTIIGATCSPNAPTILKQFKSNQLTEVPIGGITTESTVVFVGDLSDVDASDVLSLQIEVRPLGQEFTGVPTHTQSTAFANPQPCSSPVANCGRITVTGMTRSLEYHWRARVRDNKGGYSAWISFGANNENERDILLTGNPAAIQFVSGNSQSGTVNTNLPSPLVVRVVDVEGYPVPGYTVNWTVVAGATGGQLVAGNAVTDNDGYSSRTYKLGQKIGTNTIRAAGSGLAGSPIDFSATGNPDVIAKFTVTGPQYAITNEQFGPVTVTAYDQYDNVKVDYIGTPAVSAVKAVDGSASAGTISPSTLSFTIENAGIVELSTFSHNTVESIRIKITDGAATGLSNTIAIVDSLGSCPDVDGIIDGNQTWTSDLTNMGIFDCRNVEMVWVTSNAVLTLTSYNNGNGVWTDDFGATVLANDIVIDSGSTISSNARGYSQNRGGGTQGVYGGYSYNNNGTPYGSVYEPRDLGSSSGGGAIKLVVEDTLTNNGSITSNGNTNTVGSGGSIWIDTDILAGSGTIAANAGTNSDYRAANGSGGRIAVYYSDDQSTILNTLGTASPKITAQSTGGMGQWSPKPSGAGTIYIENKINDVPKQGSLFVRNLGDNTTTQRAAIVQANEVGISEFVFKQITLTNAGHLDVVGQTSTITLTQGDKLTGDATTPRLSAFGTFKYTGEDTLVISGADVAIRGKLELVNGYDVVVGGSIAGKLTLYANTWYYNDINNYVFNDVSIASNGTINLISYNNGDSNWTNDYGLTFNAENLNIASGGKLSASGTGYGQNRGGGTYGVYGGYANNSTGTPYGSVYEPKDLGSSSGGGAIKLVVTETLTNNGTIESNGNAQTVGSGGSIWIDTNTIAGSGTIAANGSTNSDYRAANGSGGRIAVYYNDDQSGMLNTLGTASPKIQANSTGGMGQWSPKPSGAGTIYVEDKANDTSKQGSLFVRNVGDNLATHRAAIIMSQETGVTEFVFKQIKLTNAGHLDIVENTSIINLTQGDKLTGDSTAPKLVASGIFRYSGEDTLVVDGTDVTINGKLELVNGDDVELGGNLPGKLTLYANTWYYNNENTHLFGDITVNSNGTLNLVSYNNGDSNWANDYGVTLSAENITVAEGGIVTASGTGYGQNRGGGNQGVYGGYATDGTGTPYGSVYEPKDLGSSSGGGAIKLIISNTLTNNGTIQSNGNAQTVGSGGSIWIDTNTIAGSGNITANGGTNSDYRSLNGSGGRIAIYYNTDNSEILNTLGTGSAKVLASSTGCDCDWTPKPSGAGTVYTEDKQNDTPKQGSLFIRNVQTSNKSRAAAIIITQETDIDKFVFKRVNLTSYGNLSVVGNDSVFELSNGEGLNGDSTLASLITFGTFNYTGEDTLKIDGADLTIRGNMVLQNNNVQIGGTNAGGLTLYANTWHYNNENRHELGDVHVTPNGVLKLVSYNSGDSDWTNDYGVQLTTNNLTVDEGGVVTSSGFGYGQNRGGGAQGVYGGYAYNESGTPYGSLFEPVDLGSSSGGGAMKLIINETLINNGSILSNGNAETAGSGGSIWIDTDILAGNGIITANAGTNSDYRAINGSGGRVAIYYVTDESGMLSTMGTDAQKIEARSNGCICEWVPYPSGPGTVYIENKGVVEPHQGDLFIHNGGGQGRAMDFDATDYFFNNVYIGKNVKVKMNQNLSAIRSNESISDEENVEDTGDAFAIWTFEEEADGSCSGGGDYCDTSNNNRNLSAVGSERTTGKVGNGLLLTGENYAEVDIPGAWVSSFSVGMRGVPYMTAKKRGLCYPMLLI